MSHILTGLDLITEEGSRLAGLRLGLLANQASLNSRLTHAKEIICRAFPGALKALFGPQHGFCGREQDNMIETGHGLDKHLNIPIYSLYSETREPSAWMLKDIDAIIIDLQDVGTRVYTFTSTMLGCMRAAARLDKKVFILDRPNPIGGEIIEGNILSLDLTSFVGPCGIPMRHGMTMGEMGLMFNKALGIECDLSVITMKGWKRGMLWPDTGLRWLMPSPNMPCFETALVYPGQVLWEGSNLSEGRGTCRPFEIFGAPYLDPTAVAQLLKPSALAGCMLQPYEFQPTFNKWAGMPCRGFMIHLLDPLSFRPYRTSLSLLKAVMAVHGEHFRFKDPPYEYDYERRPIDLILGEKKIPERLTAVRDVTEMEESWREGLEAFLKMRKEFLLYP
jgi:uncharacterized protein YbbC (DUF1343 family)